MTRRAGQRRPLAFPVAVVAIIVIGTLLVLLARDSRIDADAQSPTAGEHWHSAFGTYICDQFGPNIPDDGPDRLGIHSHADGLIHIHPFGGAGSGNDATLGKFFDQVGLEVTDDSWEVVNPAASPESAAAGDTCTTEDGETDATRVVLLVWPPQAGDTTDPTVITSDYADVPLEEDGQSFVLALIPEDMDPEDVPLPPSVATLEAPGDVIEAPQVSIPATTAPASDATGADPAGDATVEGDATTTDEG